MARGTDNRLNQTLQIQNGSGGSTSSARDMLTFSGTVLAGSVGAQSPNLVKLSDRGKWVALVVASNNLPDGGFESPS